MSYFRFIQGLTLHCISRGDADEAARCAQALARKGYEVYHEGAVAAERVAIIGSDGLRWLARAIAEADRRAAFEAKS